MRRFAYHRFRRTRRFAGGGKAERRRDAAHFVQPAVGGDDDLDGLAAAGYFFQRRETVADLAVERGGKTRAYARQPLFQIVFRRHVRSLQEKLCRGASLTRGG